MNSFSAQVRWERNEAPFRGGQYSRGHQWSFDGGQVVPASSSPHIVPLPHSVAANVDPEEAYVAALSSCHMLFFLSLAAEGGLIVDSYIDESTGVLEKSGGALRVTRVDLRPRVVYAEEGPGPGIEQALHHRAHAMCFLANSVHTVITVHLEKAR